MLHEFLGASLQRPHPVASQCSGAHVEHYTEEILTPERVNLRIRIRRAQGHLLHAALSRPPRVPPPQARARRRVAVDQARHRAGTDGGHASRTWPALTLTVANGESVQARSRLRRRFYRTSRTYRESR